MIIINITLKIDKFNNATMQADPSGEVSKILLQLAKRTDEHGVVGAFDYAILRDSEGNAVGECTCNWEEGDDE